MNIAMVYSSYSCGIGVAVGGTSGGGSKGDVSRYCAPSTGYMAHSNVYFTGESGTGGHTDVAGSIQRDIGMG